MFGRPLAAAPVGEDIVLAVGARTGRVFIFYLEFSPPTALPVVSLIADIPVGDSARKLAVADFNGDTFPDFVVAGFGPVELIMSDSGSSTPSYPNSPITILNERGDSIDATNEYVAVGVKGGKRDPGEVHIFGMQFGLTGTVLGPNEDGGKFGQAVALEDVLGNDGLLDLIVGAPGVDLAGGGRKDTDWGEAFRLP